MLILERVVNIKETQIYFQIYHLFIGILQEKIWLLNFFVLIQLFTEKRKFFYQKNLEYISIANQISTYKTVQRKKINGT